MSDKHLENEKDKYISLEEACELLETTRQEVEGLSKRGELHAFHLGDLVRFRKDQVSELKAQWRINRDLFEAGGAKPHAAVLQRPSAGERVRDFVYFNDFYILSSVVIAALLYLILSSQ